MIDTRMFREQHKRILKKAGEVSELVKKESLEGDALEARLAVAELAGWINVHLAMEDEALYPELVNAPEASVREKARDFIEEMGGIRSEFAAYVKTWAHTDAAEKEPGRFIRETNDMLRKLSNRIYREDNDLYPEVEGK